jgi:hypothetical protein
MQQHPHMTHYLSKKKKKSIHIYSLRIYVSQETNRKLQQEPGQILQVAHTDLLTFVPRNVIRGRRAAKTTPFSPTVTATLRKVPPFPHFGQKIFPISAVTV